MQLTKVCGFQIGSSEEGRKPYLMPWQKVPEESRRRKFSELQKPRIPRPNLGGYFSARGGEKERGNNVAME